MDSLDVNDACIRPITNLKGHFCTRRNHKNAHNQRKVSAQLHSNFLSSTTNGMDALDTSYTNHPFVD